MKYTELLKNITSLGLSQRLKARDIEQESLFYWVTYDTKDKQAVQIVIKTVHGNFYQLYGDVIPPKPDHKKLRYYSAFLTFEIKEILREFRLRIISFPHRIGKKSPYVCMVQNEDGTENTNYPHILENHESEAEGLMLYFLKKLNKSGIEASEAGVKLRNSFF